MTHSVPTLRSSDLHPVHPAVCTDAEFPHHRGGAGRWLRPVGVPVQSDLERFQGQARRQQSLAGNHAGVADARDAARTRSEEHTSELQSLMRISYAVYCLKKPINYKLTHENT